MLELTIRAEPTQLAPLRHRIAALLHAMNRSDAHVWRVSIAASELLTLSITFYLLASNASSSLEGKAFDSNQTPCPSPIAPPCHAFSNEQKDLQAKGKRYEMLSTVTMALALARRVPLERRNVP